MHSAKLCLKPKLFFQGDGRLIRTSCPLHPQTQQFRRFQWWFNMGPVRSRSLIVSPGVLPWVTTGIWAALARVAKKQTGGEGKKVDIPQHIKMWSQLFEGEDQTALAQRAACYLIHFASTMSYAVTALRILTYAPWTEQHMLAHVREIALCAIAKGWTFAKRGLFQHDRRSWAAWQPEFGWRLLHDGRDCLTSVPQNCGSALTQTFLWLISDAEEIVNFFPRQDQRRQAAARPLFFVHKDIFNWSNIFANVWFNAYELINVGWYYFHLFSIFSILLR